MNLDRVVALLKESLEERRKAPIVEYGERIGYVYDGWKIEDYIDAAIRGKIPSFENVVIWGPMGTLKSNLAMQLAHHVYNDWDLVLERMILTPEELIKLYDEAAQSNQRIPLIILDDITSTLPKHLWFFNRKQFARLHQLVAVIRKQFGCIISTTPRPENVIGPLAEVMKNEITTFPNREALINRYVWLPSEKAMESKFKKIALERRKIDMYKVPSDVFMKYDQKRDAVAKVILRQMNVDQVGKDVKKQRMNILDLPNETIIEKVRESGIKISQDKARMIVKVIKNLASETEIVE